MTIHEAFYILAHLPPRPQKPTPRPPRLVSIERKQAAQREEIARLGWDDADGDLSLKPIRATVRIPQTVSTKLGCQHPSCYEDAFLECDNCGKRFCSDHGSPGADREVPEVGMVAQPARCWKCGGFDADA